MALQIVLVVVGLAIAGANVYPLVTYFLAGPSPTGSTTAPMFWTIYATLGVFLVLAAKNPSAHRSLIAYAIWSSVAHTAVMALMATQLPAKRAELLVGVAVTGLSAALLFVFARISAGRERVIALFLVFVAAPLGAQTPLQGRVDSVFKQYASTETPGCAIGVAQRGRVLLERAFGMADLQRDGTSSLAVCCIGRFSCSVPWMVAEFFLSKRVSALAIARSLTASEGTGGSGTFMSRSEVTRNLLQLKRQWGQLLSNLMHPPRHSGLRDS